MSRAALKNLVLPLIALVGLALSACSDQWREADPGVSADQVSEILDDVRGISEASSGGKTSALFDALYDDPDSTLYYTEGPGPLGTPQSVASLVDFSFMGLPEASPYDFDRVVVFFITGVIDGRSEASLLVHIVINDQKVTEVFDLSEDPDFGKEENVYIMNEQLVLRSYDLSKEYDQELGNVIQLRVGLFNEDGVEDNIGKFSTLVGFGPR